MGTIRVLLVNIPRLLREIVRVVMSTQPDLEFTGEFTGDFSELASALDRLVVDVVILGTERTEAADLLLLLLNVRPSLRVVVIADDGRKGFVCTSSGELSLSGLLVAVRGR